MVLLEGSGNLEHMLQKLPESVGHALINQRAGMEQVLYNLLHRERTSARLSVSSPTFPFNGALPTRYTADGSGVSPPLEWDAVPPGAGSIAILVEDADSPTPHPLVHAIVVDIDPEIRTLEEGALASHKHEGAGLETGPNSYLQRAWLPPDPPPGHGEHRYVFQVFALMPGPNFATPPGRRELLDVILNRALAVGCLIGTYERGQRVGPAGEERAAAEDAPLADLSSQ
jgi:Raf kinase inhibitor-like YbhB/YbcL family protein